ncbi:MAG: hypothetical protein FWF57_00660 [Defluviitaleaceae bacterium]|nr:hypothetical protein [Defluviitaleaceae bacterium]
MQGFLKNNTLAYTNKDIFLKRKSSKMIASKNYSSIKGGDTAIYYKDNSLIATIGEFFERETMINLEKVCQNQIAAISLVTGKLSKIPMKNVISQNEIVDSCGMASHVSSQRIIEKCFYEFFERQSFISNFLGKLKAKRISLSKEKAKDEILQNQHNYLLNYVDEIYYYDLSLYNRPPRKLFIKNIKKSKMVKG